ncbi:glycosyl transferase [Noviherbaspirillum sp. UKPF54]|nr:glycosyl transferase [Noviherbaspirillum sp. UKPF54]
MVATVALVHIVIALLPEVAYDALAMHLFIPAHLALRHQWGFDASSYVWAVMPMLGDWVFAIGYMLGGETAARLINVGFILTITWYVRELVIWAGGTAIGARWAALIFLSTPLTFTESSSLFIESVWTTFVVAGILAILKACSSVEETKHNLLIGGALLGFAAAAKAVTFTVIPALLIVLICRYKIWTKAEFFRVALLGIAAFLLVGAIPYVTAWILTGNPVFPLFNKVFKSPFYPPENFEAPAVFGKGMTWDLLYRMTFESGRYLEGRTGSAGFQWLPLFIPSAVLLIGFRLWRGGGLMLVGVLCVSFTFSSTAYLRYVFPSFAILAACVGIAFGFANRIRSFVYPALCLAGSAVVGLNLLFLNAYGFYPDFQLTPLISEDMRRGYLQTRLPVRNAVELVNQLNAAGAPVAVFAQPLTAGLAADALYPTWYNLRFYSLIHAARNEQAIVDALASNGVDFVIFDSGWGDAEKRKLIEASTEEIAELGTVTVRRIASAYRFQSELLKYPDFTSPEGWSSGPEGISRAGNGIAVSVVSPAFQSVPVMQKRRYLYSVKARCNGQPTQGRMQVNWTDAKSQFIGTEIRVFDCMDSPTEYKMEIIAPPKATLAVVYASGHTSIPLVFERVSFRQ